MGTCFRMVLWNDVQRTASPRDVQSHTYKQRAFCSFAWLSFEHGAPRPVDALLGLCNVSTASEIAGFVLACVL